SYSRCARRRLLFGGITLFTFKGLPDWSGRGDGPLTAQIRGGYRETTGRARWIPSASALYSRHVAYALKRRGKHEHSHRREGHRNCEECREGEQRSFRGRGARPGRCIHRVKRNRNQDRSHTWLIAGDFRRTLGAYCVTGDPETC